MDVRDESEGEEREAPRRAILKALASAPVIVSLLPGRARAEYVGEKYFPGSCDDNGDYQKTEEDCEEEDDY